MNDKEKLLVIKYLASTIKNQYKYNTGAHYENVRIPDTIRDEMDNVIATRIERHFNDDISNKYTMLIEIERLADSIIELSDEDYTNA